MAVEYRASVDELWERYLTSRDADVKNKIVTHYLYIVGVIVKRLKPQYNGHSEKDELMSCGVLGLIDAVDKYDSAYGVKFQTYAAVRIRGEILDYMRRQDWAPTSLRRKISDIQKAGDVLEARFNRTASDQEIADYLGLRAGAVRKIRQKMHMFNLVYFEDLPYEKDQGILLNQKKTDPYQIVENEAVRETLREIINNLPERKKTVIVLHYYKGMTMKSIAKKLQISESRVSQIHSRILSDMKICLQA